MLATNIDEHFYLSKEKTQELLQNLNPNVKKKLYQSMENINNISLHKKGSVLTKPQTTIQSTHPTSTKHYNPCITTNNIGCYQITN